ncbi:MAG: hypothetical protein K8J08_20680 [Thermoanaerobaculia bacterium]|nr:hypothetical protein [Thermoanaerobaculia bacterium]
MSTKLTLPAVGLLLALALGSSLAAQKPAASDDRQTALSYVEVLETEPGSESARQAAGWLTEWLIKVEDLTVNVCPAILGPERKLKDLPPTLTLQHMYSQAAYQIKHPDADPGSLPVYLAGVQGTLRTYRAMKERGEVEEYRLLEELLALEQEDQLEPYVAKRSKECH